MKKLERRKKLHSYIADLDDAKVTALLTLFEEEAVYKTKKHITANEKKEILRREVNRTSGKTKIYTIAQAKKLIRQK